MHSGRDRAGAEEYLCNVATEENAAFEINVMIAKIFMIW
jgi:hypothetical protein